MRCAYCLSETQEIIRTEKRVGLQIPICGKCSISKKFEVKSNRGHCDNESSKRIELKDGFTIRICNDWERLRDL
jgi:hypothetical protein